MKKTIVVYGSTTGTCEAIAEVIANKLQTNAISASALTKTVVNMYDVLLLGTSTWGAGEVQDDWYDAINTLKDCNLQNKTVALFGCGDSYGYSDTFCGGMAEIYNAVKDSGANIVGMVPASDYHFSDSNAVIDGNFVGLALDNDNESNMTPSRINSWLEAIKPSL